MYWYEFFSFKTIPHPYERQMKEKKGHDKKKILKAETLKTRLVNNFREDLKKNHVWHYIFFEEFN